MQTRESSDLKTMKTSNTQKFKHEAKGSYNLSVKLFLRVFQGQPPKEPKVSLQGLHVQETPQRLS